MTENICVFDLDRMSRSKYHTVELELKSRQGIGKYYRRPQNKEKTENEINLWNIDLGKMGAENWRKTKPRTETIGEVCRVLVHLYDPKEHFFVLVSDLFWHRANDLYWNFKLSIYLSIYCRWRLYLPYFQIDVCIRRHPVLECLTEMIFFLLNTMFDPSKHQEALRWPQLRLR